MANIMVTGTALFGAATALAIVEIPGDPVCEVAASACPEPLPEISDGPEHGPIGPPATARNASIVGPTGPTPPRTITGSGVLEAGDAIIEGGGIVRGKATFGAYPSVQFVS